MKYTDNQIYNIVSHNIKLYRVQNKLTQRELSEKANISYSYLSKIESGSCDQSFSLSTLNQIANALDVDIADFFKEGGEKTMRQVDYIVMALRNLGGEANYSDIYDEYEKITHTKLTAGKKAGIRRVVEDHSSDSDNFKAEDLFYSVYGKGQGWWGLRK